MTITPDSDAPICPRCDYLLVGLQDDRCPECGTILEQDRSIYRPSRRSTPWSADQPSWLILGVPLVILHPIRTLSWCSVRSRVTIRWAIIFAMIISVGTAALWPVMRDLGVELVNSPSRPGDALRILGDQLRDPMHWRRVGVWEAWSISRWWILLATIALIWPSSAAKPEADRGVRSERLVRLLLFAPWISFLELLFLVGVWFVMPAVVPEPSTLFGISADSFWAMCTERFWLVRGVLPSAAVGLVFFRAVLGCRWHTALILSLAFIPLALATSVVWSLLFEPLGILRLAYGG